MSVTPVEADPMNDSILNDVKKVLSLDPSYTEFDTDILLFVNSVFSNLTQLGVGPDTGYAITGANETWGEFLGTNKRLNNVKTYISLKVRLQFDPPKTPHTIAAFEKIIAEQEFRISAEREQTHWVSPDTTLPDSSDPFEDEVVIDGGIVR